MEGVSNFDIATKVTDSLIDVFDTMLSMELELSGDDGDVEENLSQDRMVGSVSVAGEVMGSIVIHVSREFSRIMTGSMLGLEPEEVEDEEDIKDVMSEICNIVGGNLKSSFCDAGMECRLSTPSFTIGNDFGIESLNAERHERYVFSYQNHTVVAEVGIRAGEAIDENFEEAFKGRGGGEAGNIEELDNLDIKGIVTDSMNEIFETMLSLDLAPYTEAIDVKYEGDRVVGSVGFAGSLRGSLNIHISGSFCRFMTAAMLGMEVEEIEGEEEMKDVIGEITNILAGNLKSKLSDAGFPCVLSTPSYTNGRDFIIESQAMDKYERLGFYSGEEDLLIEVGFKAAETWNSVSEKDGEGLAVGDAQKIIDGIVKDTPQPEEESPVEFPDNYAEGDQDEVTEDRAEEPDKSRTHNLDLVLDIPVDIAVELGSTKKEVSEILKLGRGSIVELSQLDGEPVDILVNQKLIGRGEVLVEKEKYGIRVTEMKSRKGRIDSLRNPGRVT